MVSIPSLQTREIAHAFADRRVLDGVSMDLAPGEILAICGPNGAGKTTLLRICAGVLQPKSGSVTLGESRIHRMPPTRRARHLALIAQHPQVAFSYSVAQIVAMGRFAATRPHRKEVLRALERVELHDRADEPFAQLSAGQRQRAALARALLQIEDPGFQGFLLADEPFSAMDPRHVLRAIDLIRALARERSVGVAIVLHDLNLALRLCDRTLVLGSCGRVFADGPSDRVIPSEALRRAFATAFRAVGDARDRLVIADHPD